MSLPYSCCNIKVPVSVPDKLQKPPFPILTHGYYLRLVKNRTTVDIEVFSSQFQNYQIPNVPQTLSVEFLHDTEGKSTIKEYMFSKGFVAYTEITHPNNLANDFIFVKRELLQIFNFFFFVKRELLQIFNFFFFVKRELLQIFNFFFSSSWSFYRF